jgi:hypothetical protein
MRRGGPEMMVAGEEQIIYLIQPEYNDKLLWQYSVCAPEPR